MQIAESARKHGVADEDMTHAVRNFITEFAYDEDFTMLVGAATNGALLEVGVLEIDSDDPTIIHAMPCRDQFLPHL